MKIGKIVRNKLLWILIFAIAIRIFGLGLQLYSDETVWAESVLNASKFIQNPELYIPHPPLAVISYIATTSLFGFSSLGFRMMPFIVGLIAIIVTYMFSKEIYDRRTALVAALLMAVTFYPVWAGLYVDVDGNLLMLFTLLTLFSYFKFSKSHERKFMILTGVFFGLAMLSKYPAVLIPAILIIYDWFGNRLKNARSLLMIFVLAGIVFSVFPAFSFLAGSPELFLRTVGWGTTNIEERSIFSTTGLDFLWMSPLKTATFLFLYGIPFAALLSLMAFFWKRREKEKIVLIYLLVFLFFYTFVLFGGIKLRYLMVVIPALYMLSARMISDIFGKVRRREILLFAILFAVFFAAIYALSSYGVKDNFNSQTSGLDLIVNNAFFWYSGHGSPPFAIHIHSFLFASGLSVVVFLLMIRMQGNKDRMKVLAIMLISLSMAYNFFVVSQSFDPTVGPDYTATYHELQNYLETGDVKEPIYFAIKGFQLFTKGNLIGLSTNLEKYDLDGSVAIINVQVFGNPSYDTLEIYLNTHCKINKIFYSNDFPFGYVFEC